MKIVLFILHISYFIFLAAVPAAAARLPIIIDKADLSHPLDTEDQNYLPSDPNKVATVKHSQTINISQTFSPILAGTDAAGNQVYLPQTIDQIQQNLNLTQYTNNGLDYFNSHLAKRFVNPLASPEDISAEFRSYQSSNLTRRSLPFALQQCLIGQRMVSAVKTLTPPLRGTTVDVVICQSPTCPHPVRISEVASALRDQNLFFDPDTPCSSAANLVPLSSLISPIPPISFSLDSATYHQLHQFAIEPVDDNSLAMIVEQCDLNSQSQPVNCKKQLRSLPLGAGPAGNGQTVMKNLIPASAAIISRDYSQTSFGVPIADQPNPISFLAKYFKLFLNNLPLKETTNFTGPTQVTYSLDQRLEQGLATDETALRYLLPAKANQQINPPASTTNGQGTLDPGNPSAVLRHHWDWLLPLSRQF